MLVYTRPKSCSSRWAGALKASEVEGSRSPCPSSFRFLQLLAVPEAGSPGPGWARRPDRSLCRPLLGEMARAEGRSQEGGLRSRGKGRDARLS